MFQKGKDVVVVLGNFLWIGIFFKYAFERPSLTKAFLAVDRFDKIFRFELIA